MLLVRCEAREAHGGIRLFKPSPIIALPFYGAIFSFFEPVGYESTMLTGALGTLIFVPGMIFFGSIPAVTGAAVARLLNRSIPEKPVSD